MKTIFISSTFADMQKERDALRDITSPKVNAEARKYGDHIEFCDLRWGISTEDMEAESASLKVLDVCLDEIDRSNPPIIILLGYRYGWIPDGSLVRSIAERRELALEDLRLSATALEAEYGAIAKGRTALVYCREIGPCEGSVPNVFLEEDDERSSLVKSLKERLVSQPNCQVKTYKLALKDGRPDERDLETFANMVSRDLIEAFRNDWGRFEAMAPSQRERERQWAFVREKDAAFTARALDANRLMIEISKSQTTLCQGAPGSGKSTLSSHIALMALDHGWDVLPLIGGLTDESDDAMDVLRNTVYYLEDILEMPHFSSVTAQSLKRDGFESNPSLDEWQDRLRSLGAEYAETGRSLLVVVDAVDQLFPDEVRNRCDFIPDGLSNHVRFFLSSLPDIALPVKNVYALQPLSREDQKKVVDGVFKRHGKELAPRVEERLLEMDASSSPYYVSLAAQRLQMMDSDDFEDIRNRAEQGRRIEALGSLQIEILDSCPGQLEEMCVELFKEAGRRTDDWFVSEVLNYLAVSRYGLRRGDLAALLDEDWSELKFSHMINLLQEDFQIRADGRIDFMHRSPREGLRNQLGSNRSYDVDILNYLDKLDPHDKLRMEETAHHAIRANNANYLGHFTSSFCTGADADEEIATATAATIRSACLNGSQDWLINAVRRASSSDDYSQLGLLWLVIRYLPRSFGETERELIMLRNLLVEAEKTVAALDDRGLLSENNRRAYRSVLSQEIIVLGPDDRTMERSVDNLLEFAHENNPLQTPKEKLALLSTCYRIIWSIQNGRSNPSRALISKCASIGEYGLNLIDGSLVEYALFHNSPVIGFYFGALGTTYAKLGETSKSVELHKRDSEYRKASYDHDQTPFNLLSLSGGLINLAKSYARTGTPRAYQAAYEAIREAIEHYEDALAQQAVLSHDEVFYRFASMFKGEYFTASQYYLNATKVGGAAIGPSEMERAVLWAFRGCDSYRELYRENRDKNDLDLLQRSVFFLQELELPRPTHEKVIDWLETWAREDDNALSFSDDDNEVFIAITTCLATARIVSRSGLKSGYEFALERCLRGLDIAETIRVEPITTRRFWASELHKAECQIEIAKSPASVAPLKKRAASEEKLAQRFGEPSEALGDSYRDLAIFYGKYGDASDLENLSQAAWNALNAYEAVIDLAVKTGKGTENLQNKRAECQKMIEAINKAPSHIAEAKIDYGVLIRRAAKQLSDSTPLKSAAGVPAKAIENAIANYAYDVDAASVIAIDGAGFPSRGKRGVLYTARALYSSELPEAGGIPFDDIELVTPYGDSLCFQLKDGSRSILDFGPYRNEVLETMSRILRMRDEGNRQDQSSRNWNQPASRQRTGSTTYHAGRNDPCPCGSGKKFKYCHGSNT